MTSAIATCTYGNGPDVLVRVARLKWPYRADRAATAGSFELTADEALDLSKALVEAALQAKRLAIEVNWKKPKP